MASGPGMVWQIAMASRICSLVIHCLSDTSSRSIWPTSATGPPKPSRPSRRKYLTTSPIAPLDSVASVAMWISVMLEVIGLWGLDFLRRLDVPEREQQRDLVCRLLLAQKNN